jgi:HK97 family phage prohead protease
MPFSIIQQACDQADGIRGTHVIINDDTGEQIGCYMGMNDAQDVIAYLNERYAEEQRSMNELEVGSIVAWGDGSQDKYGMIEGLYDSKGDIEEEHQWKVEEMMVSDIDPLAKIYVMNYDEETMEFLKDKGGAYEYHYMSSLRSYEPIEAEELLPDDDDLDIDGMLGLTDLMDLEPEEGYVPLDDDGNPVEAEPQAIVDDPDADGLTLEDETGDDEPEPDAEAVPEMDDEEEEEDPAIKTTGDNKVEKKSDDMPDEEKAISKQFNIMDLSREDLVKLIRAMGHSDEELIRMMGDKAVKEATPEKMKERYDNFHSLVNMSASEIQKWGESECSNLASRTEDGGLGGDKVRKRVIRLLGTKLEDWNSQDFADAGDVVGFISRMSNMEQGEPVREGCPSKRDISLLNWGHNPNRKGGSPEKEDKPLEKKAVRLKNAVEVDSTNPNEARFSGYGNVYNHRDLGGDVMKGGVFTRSIKAREGRFPLLADHKTEMVDALGVAYVTEDEKGLKTELVINTETQFGMETASNIRFFIKHKVPIGLSVGYTATNGYHDRTTDSRVITEAKLYEMTVTLFPMNELSLIQSAKSLLKKLKPEEVKKLIQEHQPV